MKSVIRIVKRGKPETQPEVKEGKEERRVSSEREIANTIKSWITDREQRRRLTERTNWELLTKFAQ